MVSAAARVRAARATLEVDPAAAVAAAYYAALYAARAALSEREEHARTHRGTWHRFRETFVLPGTFDEGLYQRVAALQKSREAADYDAATIDEREAADLLADAERFVEAVAHLLAANG